MGLFDVVGEVLTEYKADASQQIAAIEELSAAEQQLAAKELETAEARSEHSTQWLEQLGKMTLALAAVKEAAEIVWEGYNEGIKEQRLQNAAFGVDLEGISKALHGTMTEMQVLEFAAKANHSAFHNTQEDMENAARAIRALEARGVPAGEAISAVTEALVTGRTRGLVPYGIEIDKHIKELQGLDEANLSAAEHAELHTRAMQALKVVGNEVSDSQDELGESMQRTVVSLENSWADLKKQLGQLAVAFQPVLEALAKTVGYITVIADKAGKIPGLGAPGSGGPNMLEVISDGSPLNFIGDETGWFDKDGKNEDPIYLELVKTTKAIKDGLAARTRKLTEEIEMPDDQVHRATKEEAKQAMEAAARAILRGAVMSIDRNIGGGGAGGSLGAAAVSGPGGWGTLSNESVGAHELDSVMSGIDLGVDQQQAELASRVSRYNAFNARSSDKKLEKIFGPVGEFDLYKEAFKGLSNAVSGAMSAWIDGSMTAGQAFKKFIGDALKSLSSQMLIEALKHGAYALGSLAFGDASGAARHAAAAAAFGAGAIAAGIAAKELGGGGNSQSASSGAGAGSSSGASYGGGAGGAQPSTGPIIVYGDSFAEDSPRNRQIRAEKMVALALGTSSGQYH